MRHFRTSFVLAMILAASLAPGTAAQAQDHGITIGLLGGIGGSPDSEGYDGSGIQLLAALELGPLTSTGIRLGELTTDFADSNGIIAEADLSYITIGTEYKRNSEYYDSGFLIALGYYQLDSISDDEESLGLSVGVTGDFKLTSRFSVLVEFSGHYADFDAAQFFLLGHVGLAFRF